jgi:nicotinic acid mononucleotide adenylyltransferase
MEKLTVIIYQGSFDPIHNGHIEALIYAIGLVVNLYAAIIMPNTPGGGYKSNHKPNRSPLYYRSFLLYLMGYPIFTNQEYLSDSNLIPVNKIVVDNSDVTISFDNIKDKYNVIGIIGSDILNKFIESGKPPKWNPHSWFIFERKDNLIENKNISNINNIPCVIIPIENTKYQHLSSTLIKTLWYDKKNIKDLVPTEIIPWCSPVSLGLSNKKKRNYISDDMFIKEFFNEEDANKYINKVNLWKNHISNDIIISPNFIKKDNSEVYMTFYKGKTLMESICEKDFEKVNSLMIIVATKINDIHNTINNNSEDMIIHGEINPNNLILGNGNNELIIIDFEETTQINDNTLLLKEYYKFWSSIIFFSKLYGVHIPYEDISKWIVTFNRNYDFKEKFNEDIHNKWINKYKLFKLF